MEIVLPMDNAHPHFSLKNLAKNNAHYTWQNMVYLWSVKDYCPSLWLVYLYRQPLLFLRGYFAREQQ